MKKRTKYTKRTIKWCIGRYISSNGSTFSEKGFLQRHRR